MSIVERQVRRASRRLNTNVLLENACIGLLVGAAAFALFIAIERAFTPGLPELPALIGAAVLALVMTLVGTYASRVNGLAAAVALDRAVGLKERVSTALVVARRPDEFSQAAVRDAERTAGSLHVPTHLPLRSPRMWPWSLGTVAVAALTFWLMPPLDLLAGIDSEVSEEERQAAADGREDVEAAMAEQRERVARRLQDKPHMEALAEAFKELELPDKPTETPEDVRREAVKKIEKLSEKVKERLERDDLAGMDELKKQLAKLERKRGDDPASKLSQALASGDMQAAKQSLEELKKQLEEAANNADAATRERIAQMQKTLDDLAANLNELAGTEQLEKELQNKAGLSEEEAKKLAEKLAGMDMKQIEEALKQALGDKMSAEQIAELARKLAQKQQAMQQMKNLAQAMSQACMSCNSASMGDKSGMMKQLDGAMAQLSKFEMAEQMMFELQAQLSELEALQSACNGGLCSGTGGPPSWKWEEWKKGGAGLGRGIGSGIGDRSSNLMGDYDYDPRKAASRVRGGEVIGQMLIDGAPMQSEASAEAHEAVRSAVRDAEDAINREEIPRQYHNVAQRYFEALAGLASRREAAPASPPADSPADDVE